MSKLTSTLTTIIMIVIFLQMAPTIVKSLKNTYDDMFELKTKVGLIKINQPIMNTGSYLKGLRKLFERNDIKAIMLHIECPGGAAGSSQALYNEILAFKKENPKPVVVLTNDLCASGAYYIACASDYIIASPAALIGSIGTYIATFKVKELMESWKIQYHVTQTGKYKTALNPFTDSNSELNEFVQKVSDDVYKQFINDVAARRKLSVANADKWANGKFFTGRQALELGLIDETGSESNAIKKIRELAMIEKEKEIQWVKPPKPGFYEQLLGNDDDSDDNTSAKSSLVDSIVEKLCIKLGYKEHSQIMMN